MGVNLIPNKSDHYSQVNNELNPFSACQCTVATMALDCIDKGIRTLQLLYKYNQPEDNLYWYIENTPEVMEFCIRSHGPNWNEIVDHPAEWADVKCFAINRIYGRKRAYFDADLTMEKIKYDLNEGIPVSVSMKYPSIPGHYVLVVGYRDDGCLIINDPYRNTLKGKDFPDGFNCIYTPDEFAAHHKKYGVRFLK